MNLVSQNSEVCAKCENFGKTSLLRPCMGGEYSKPNEHISNKQCDVMIVVEAPDEIDEKIDMVFADDKAGPFLRKILREDFKITDYFITNVVKCNSSKEIGYKKNKRSIQQITPVLVKRCKYYLDAEMDIVNPKYVLLLGNSAMLGAVKKSGLGKHHGNPIITGDGRIYIATYNPLAILHNAKFMSPFVEDINIFTNIVRAKGDINSARTPVNYTYVDSMEMLSTMVQDLLSCPVIAFDIESSGLNPWKNSEFYKTPPQVVCISLSGRDNTSWLVPLDHTDTPFSQTELPIVKNIIKNLLENPKILKCAHNHLYDVKYLKVVLGIDTQGVIFDTMLASYLLNEEGGDHGLKDLALRYTDLGDYEYDLAQIRKEIKPKSEQYNYSLIPLSKLFNYAAADADATIRLYNKFVPKLQEEELSDVMHMLMEFASSLIDIMINGAMCDIPYAIKVTEEYAKLLKTKESEMLNFPEIKEIEEYYAYRFGLRKFFESIEKLNNNEEISDRSRVFYSDTILEMTAPEFLIFMSTKKLRDKLAMCRRAYEAHPSVFMPLKPIKFMFGSSQQLGDLIFDYLDMPVFKKTDSGAPSTDEETMNSLADKHPIITEITKYKKLKKFHSTYLAPAVPKWLGFDGMIHTSYKLHGTTTGRLSSSDPNMQNLPRDDKVVKNMIVSRFEGGSILNADFSQIELRILAVYSLDPKLIEFYRSGKDLHTQTAMTILGDEKWNSLDDAGKKSYRQVFKSINFLIVYGGTPSALAAQTGITGEEAVKFMEDYFTAFPGVVEYMKKFQAMAQDNRFIRTLTGRKRRLWNVDSSVQHIKEEALRIAINTPIQSTASDVTQRTIYNVTTVFKRMQLISKIIGTVHDSIMVDVHPSEVQIVCNIMKVVLENPDFEFLKKDGEYIVPIKCDLEIGPRYGESLPLKLNEASGLWEAQAKDA